jgi:hypothetical protein
VRRGNGRIKKLQENIAIGMNDESVYAISNETTGAGNIFTPRPSCFAHGARMLKEPIVDRPPCSLTNKGLRKSAMLLRENEEENGIAITVSHSIARWDRRSYCGHACG